MKMITKLLSTIYLWTICEGYMDYCQLPCKNPFTSATTENSACVCKLGSNCGTSGRELPPTIEDKVYIETLHNECRNNVASGNETRGRNRRASNMAALVYDDRSPIG